MNGTLYRKKEQEEFGDTVTKSITDLEGNTFKLTTILLIHYKNNKCRICNRTERFRNTKRSPDIGMSKMIN